jgi:steroid 5-alpha reductase family enzyme
MIDWWVVLFSELSIFAFMVIMFFVAIIVKDNSIIDICWSLNFVLGVSVSFIFNIVKNRVLFIPQIVSTALILIWGLRLSYHIARRNIGKGEDIRYKDRREAWGKAFYVKTFFLIFMLQALWAAVIVSPTIFVNSVIPDVASSTFIAYDNSVGALLPLVLGEVIWIVGFYYEVVGDRQLKRFIKNPENKGKIIETGLWRNTRHPNYFGEVTMSWGLFVIAISLAITNPWMWFTLIGPIMYTLLVRFVTGVTEVEKYLIKKPGYKEYQERTSPMFPWFVKKDKT